MADPLKLQHRIRVDTLFARGKLSKIAEYLGKMEQKGFDVAGVPFQLLDRALSNGAPCDWDSFVHLASLTKGGQPRLLSAIAADLSHNAAGHLDTIVVDKDAHPMTRFEAMGWAAYIAHRASLPPADAKSRDVFQFWDSAPPSEIEAGKARWASVSQQHVWYDEDGAQQFIADEFGADAAKHFKTLWHPALKSDVFRLYRLVRLGGLYADADSNPQPGIRGFLTSAGNDVWMSSMTQAPNCVVNNWFIAALPDAPFLTGLLDEVLRNTKDSRERGIFWLSGPGAATHHLFRNRGGVNVKLLANDTLKTNLFRQFDAPYKQGPQNWRVFEHAKGMTNSAGLAHVLSA